MKRSQIESVLFFEIWPTLVCVGLWNRRSGKPSTEAAKTERVANVAATRAKKKQPHGLLSNQVW